MHLLRYIQNWFQITFTTKEGFKKLCLILRKHVFDIIFLVGVITLMVLECIEFRNFKDITWYSDFIDWFETNSLSGDRQDLFYVNAIVITLFPLFDTIFAVSISLSKEKIYGIPYNEFRRLYSYSVYSISSMIFISVVLFALAIVCYYFNLILCAIVIACIAVVYMLFFIIAEFPPLLKSEFAIKIATINAYESLFGESNSVSGGNDTSREFIINFLSEEKISKIYDYLNSAEHHGIRIYKNLFKLMIQTISTDITEVNDDNSNVIKNFLDNIGEYIDYFDDQTSLNDVNPDVIELGELISSIGTYCAKLKEDDPINQRYEQITEKLVGI